MNTKLCNLESLISSQSAIIKSQDRRIKDLEKRLDEAIKTFDDAAILTIHGFCQRVLKQNAFESGSLVSTCWLTSFRNSGRYNQFSLNWLATSTASHSTRFKPGVCRRYSTSSRFNSCR